MASDTVCFSHGQDSGPWGSKIQRLADTAMAAGWTVESLDYQGMADPLARVDKCVAWCAQQDEPAVLYGSSMGGYVSAAAASRVPARGMFLLAPALFMPGYEEYMPDPLPNCPTMIVHGWRDDVVPYAGSVRYGEETGASVVLIDSDHRLTDAIDLIDRLFADFLARLRNRG
ncbi:MAG: alpha/beta fold hydrolase [Gammaproteobacteria bacterium]|nr:alpha/beta fold hydrolase [Gammaproteobacteria bacterium]NND37267.1 alpha/beta fold hydrolase [Gammaproteobacteria bacterium]